MTKVKTSIEVNGEIGIQADDSAETLFFINVDSNINRKITFLSSAIFSGSTTFSADSIVSIPFSTSFITGNITLNASTIDNSLFFVSASSANITVTIPQARNGTHFFLKKIDGTAFYVIVQPIIGLIDRTPSKIISIENTAIQLTSWDFNWWII